MPDPLHAALTALAKWHNKHFKPDDPDRQTRARLRRIGSIAEVQSDAGLVYFRLKNEVERASDDELLAPHDWLPFVASLLPYLKPDWSNDDASVVKCLEVHREQSKSSHRCRFTLGKQLGKRDQPRVSSKSVDLRFRRLIAHEELDDDFRLALVRALRLVKGKACLWCLARDLCQWQPPKDPIRTYTHPRQQWADDYYSTLLKETPTDA